MIVSITRRAEQDDKEALVAKFSERIAKRELPPQASKVIEEELAKLQLLEPASSEFNVTRNYLDWLTSLPWGVFSEENYSLRHAEQVRVPRLIARQLHSDCMPIACRAGACAVTDCTPIAF
jgi:ATP-dependent Lon protease